MRKELLGIALAPLLWASEAPAMPITAGSTLSLNGADMYTPTSIAFTGPANIGGQTGSFTALSNCTGCAAMSDFDATTPTPFPVYSAAEGGIMTSLQAATDSFVFSPGLPLPSLTVTGTGTLTLTGYDPAPGAYILTTQGPEDVAVTFSVTSIASPSAVREPATLALLDTALLGLWFLGRRRRRDA